MKYLIILLCSCMLFACSITKEAQGQDSVQTGETKTETTDNVYSFGTVEFTNGDKETDYTAWTAFLKEKDQDKATSVRIIYYTVEGDPITVTLTRNKGTYKLKHDASQDEFGTQEVIEQEYRYLYSLYGADIIKDAEKNENIKIEWTMETPTSTFWLLSNEDGKFPNYGETETKPGKLQDPYELLHMPKE